MTKPSPVSYVALAVALLALVASFGGVAEAAGHKIGKNLVVTKSIKNGAVTSAKVKDGTLSAADLAPGTIPAPSNGKSVELAGCGSCMGTAPNQNTALTPVGITSGSALSFITPVSVQIADFHASIPLQTGGQSLAFVLFYFAPGALSFTQVPLCTVATGAAGCVGGGPVTVPAGSSFFLQTTAGPAGAAGAGISIGYTMHAT